MPMERRRLAQKHINDPVRLASLSETGLLDRPEQLAMQRYARIARNAIDASVCLVSLVDADRQFFAAAEGLGTPWSERRETPLSHSFCQHVVNDRSQLVVRDARRDDRLCTNLAIEDLNVVAYAGVPLCDPNGNVLGSFCVIDVQPRDWTANELQLLNALAEAVAEEIELFRRTTLAEQAEADLAEINQEMAAAHQRASEHNAAVMHDLRVPLQVISMGVGSLADHPSVQESEALRRAVDILKRNVRQAIRLVKSGQYRPGRDDLFQPFDVAQLVARVCEDLTSHSTPTIECRVESAWVLADPVMIQRAVQNLLSNALRFASNRVNVTAAPERDLVLVSVEDDGDGLPREEDYERVWELGRRFHGARSNTGLGLAVTRQLIQALGGHTLGRPSDLGGARFELWLPQAREAG